MNNNKPMHVNINNIVLCEITILGKTKMEFSEKLFLYIFANLYDGYLSGRTRVLTAGSGFSCSML